jgi:hypothetical protein
MVEYLKLFADELPHLPLYLKTQVNSIRAGVKNLGVRNESGGENARTMNIHLWEKS